MKKLSLAGILILILMSIAALAFQNSNGKPTPRPSATVRATPKPSAGPSGIAKPTPNMNFQKPIPFVSSVFAIQTLVFLLAAGLVSFLIALSIGQVTLHDSGSAALLRATEAAVLTVLGGLFARAFIAALLSATNHPVRAQVVLGWGFFLVPGAVDSLALLFVHHVVTTPGFLLWMAMVVGAFTGMMNGLWQIHDWKGLGWLAFPLDVTWGLAGATTGALLHLIDSIITKHGLETRQDAHRYEGGARFKGRFALTQGAVMSNLTVEPSGPGVAHDSLYYHERTHVWQNRIFGPLFSLTYLGWMAVWLIPGLIAAMATKDAEAIQSWCYYNNPWETWAYLVGAGPRTGRHPLIWSELAILLVSIPFSLGVIALFVWIAGKVWF